MTPRPIYSEPRGMLPAGRSMFSIGLRSMYSRREPQRSTFWMSFQIRKAVCPQFLARACYRVVTQNEIATLYGRCRTSAIRALVCRRRIRRFGRRPCAAWPRRKNSRSSQHARFVRRWPASASPMCRRKWRGRIWPEAGSGACWRIGVSLMPATISIRAGGNTRRPSACWSRRCAIAADPMAARKRAHIAASCRRQTSSAKAISTVGNSTTFTEAQPKSASN